MSAKAREANNGSTFIAIAVIAAAIVVIAIFVGRDLYLRSQRNVTCADGSHPTIDIREFTTQYWAYSGKMEVSVANKAKVSAEIDPNVLVQVAQAIQEANEFRKYVVAGYNACAITRTEYAQLEPRFKALENTAKKIDSLLSKKALSQEEKTVLSALVTQYGDLARQPGSQ